jgi:exodeoxyribonuclease VII large subunit
MLLGHLAQRTDDLSERLNFSFRGELRRRRVRLENLGNHLRLINPGLMVEHGRELLLSLFGRGEHALRRTMERLHESTAVNSGKLQALSPLQTLSRGYAIATLLPEGTTVRASEQLKPGDTIDIRFHKGGAVCMVNAKRP